MNDNVLDFEAQRTRKYMEERVFPLVDRLKSVISEEELEYPGAVLYAALFLLTLTTVHGLARGRKDVLHDIVEKVVKDYRVMTELNNSEFYSQ